MPIGLRVLSHNSRVEWLHQKKRANASLRIFPFYILQGPVAGLGKKSNV